MLTQSKNSAIANESLDLSELSGIAKKTLIDFYHFLLKQHRATADSPGGRHPSGMIRAIVEEALEDRHCIREWKGL